MFDDTAQAEPSSTVSVGVHFMKREKSMIFINIFPGTAPDLHFQLVRIDQVVFTTK